MTRRLMLSLVWAACVLMGMTPGPVRAGDRVEELMEKTHEGKNSPWKSTRRALDGDPADWAAVNAALPRLEDMAQALLAAKKQEVRDSADGYVTAVKKLGASAKRRDRAGSRAALTALANSCADCHFKGGPGGKLDD